MITAERMLQLCPQAVPAITAVAPSSLDANLARFGVTSPLRIAYLMGQLAEESASFTTLTENLYYSSAARIAAVWPRLAGRADSLARNPAALANAAYAHINGNGDEASGDGYRYRGRGLIQITGRANYEAADRALGFGLKLHPELAAEPGHAALVALWFWQSHRCNEAADRDDIRAVTRQINPALAGLAARAALTDRAKAIFV